MQDWLLCGLQLWLWLFAPFFAPETKSVIESDSGGLSKEKTFA
jgi:hypothetical protein